ncbi:hypothetical protein [Pseudomonas sp. KU43P]|uniref:hypothetical protein n=1 Tax=Pseudomonas sp. KU43P TaxID=2487887 RepID=UPI00295569A3|nr:hypothetical protein [Pseudomonas sp. KU43P]
MRLPILASDNIRNIGAPESPYAFERFCVDAFPLVQEHFGIEKKPQFHNWLSSGYGKNGDSQFGVDVFDYSSFATGQCKSGQSLQASELIEDLEKLKGFPRPISDHFFLLATTQTPKKIQELVIERNEELDWKLQQLGQVLPSTPSILMPRLHVLNWEELKSILSRDFFLAAKWGFQPYGNLYKHLNEVDIKEVESAVMTTSCCIPAGGGGKSSSVLAAILNITAPLKTEDIKRIGSENRVSTYTVYGLNEFLNNIRNAVAYAQSFREIAPNLGSADRAARHEALEKLDSLVVHQGRIQAIKYLRRLGRAVKKLYSILKDPDSFFNPPGEPVFDIYGAFVDAPDDESVRIYSFVSEFDDLPSMPTEQVVWLAKFIGDETEKVRMNVTLI